MAQYNVIAEVISAQGECVANHKVGDRFEFGTTTPAGFCCHAFGTLWPTINLLMYGGQYPWDEEPGVATWGCPDTDNLVMFELRRVEAPTAE
jgi:uncharacterized repeat protein (TIGR04076 family)